MNIDEPFDRECREMVVDLAEIIDETFSMLERNFETARIFDPGKMDWTLASNKNHGKEFRDRW